MKTPAWLGLVVLLSVSCRKAPIEEQAPVKSTTSASASAPVRLGGPATKVAANDEASPENSRSRPLPRPEDPKHKPAPPRDTPAPTAVALKDKPGYVMSPFNDKIIDVRDLPPGTLVADPTFPIEEKKYFRVP